MYNSIKYNLLNNWSLIRWIRLGISIFIIVQAIMMHDVLFGFLGSFFMYQALTNTGCCGANVCAPIERKSTGNLEEIEFSEVKNK